MPSPLINYFLLDPTVTFLNHGSFGACPQPVFEAYQAWQRRLESQPVLFLGRELEQLEQYARQDLGNFVKADPDDLVFVPNATHGVNIVAHSLDLKPGDEILTSDHEYGACDKTWQFISQKTGVHYIHQPIPLSLSSPEEFLAELWKGVTPQTRLIFLSHITSPTAQRFPVELVCQKARAAGILTLIDGAHAPGQIDLDLQANGADFYTGNCHKWLMAPKGAGFLYARREVQPMIEPLVVSWGWIPDPDPGSRFQDFLSWTGTHDPAAYLSVPDAIRFQAEHGWDQVRQVCHTLLIQALDNLAHLFDLPLVYTNEYFLPPQMGTAFLSDRIDIVALKNRLYDQYQIEVPLIEWNGKKLIRISIQGYNTEEDTERLVEALKG